MSTEGEGGSHLNQGFQFNWLLNATHLTKNLDLEKNLKREFKKIFKNKNE